MTKREPYASVTFAPSEETRKKLVAIKRETGRSVSSIVRECVTFALSKSDLKPVKRDMFFESRALGQTLEKLMMDGLRHQLRAQFHKSLDVPCAEDVVGLKFVSRPSGTQ